MNARMRRWSGPFLWALLGVMTSLFCAQCVDMGRPLSGQVIDGSTGRALEGAYVVAFWQATRRYPRPSVLRLISDDVCRRVSTAVTDQSGLFRFRRSFWPLGLSVRAYRSVRVYKPGMIRKALWSWRLSDTERWGSYVEGDASRLSYTLVPNTGEGLEPLFREAAETIELSRRLFGEQEEMTPHAQVRNARSALSLGRCSDDQHPLEWVEPSLPVARAAYEEVRSLAKEDDEIWTVAAQMCDEVAWQLRLIGKRPALYGRDKVVVTYSPEFFDYDADPSCPIEHPAWTGADPQYREVFEQIEKDFGVKLEGMPR